MNIVYFSIVLLEIDHDALKDDIKFSYHNQASSPRSCIRDVLSSIGEIYTAIIKKYTRRAIIKKYTRRCQMLSCS
jgi:hypothetical protein